MVVVNYRTPQLTLQCLDSLAPELQPIGGSRCIVVDNASGDDSVSTLRQEIQRRRWQHWVQVMESKRNGGFSAGNNQGIHSFHAEHYLLVNSDVVVQQGCVAALLEASLRHPGAGAIGPRLMYPDRALHHSCYRFMSPGSEFLRAAATGPLSRWLSRWVTTLPHLETPTEPDWTSFACVLLKRAALQEAGPLDESFFLYFEDQDYCRTLRARGWSVLHWPSARAVHHAGASGTVRQATARRDRRPRYYYASRSRYFAKSFGTTGLWRANLSWACGRAISWLRETFGQKQPHLCHREGWDLWTHGLAPLSPHPPGEDQQ